MKPSRVLLQSSRVAALAIFCAAGMNVIHPGAAHADSEVSVPSFTSIEVRNGAHVILRHGGKRRVTLIRGNTTDSEIRVVEHGKLLVDRCPDGCGRDYRLEVEIVAPEIDALSVTDGGWLRTEGSFPRQGDLAAAVESGGILDLRAMKVDDVAAAVQQGGRILTEPRESLTAAIAEGGVVMYWGDPDISRSVVHGGVVTRGRPADRGRPFEEI